MLLSVLQAPVSSFARAVNAVAESRPADGSEAAPEAKAEESAPVEEAPAEAPAEEAPTTEEVKEETEAASEAAEA